MPQPTYYPDHDTNDANSTVTDATIQQNGWPELAQVPNVSWNWLFRTVGLWIRYLAGGGSNYVLSDDSDNLTSTAAETIFKLSTADIKYTIPAGTLAVGSRIRVRSVVRFANASGASSSFNSRIRIGGLTGLQIPATNAVDAAPSTGNWLITDAEAIVHSTGAAANIRFSGYASIAGGGGTVVYTPSTTTTPAYDNVDTTGNLDIVATGDWSHSDPLDVAVLTQFEVRVLPPV